jgi:flagellar motor switch protein FliN
MAENDRDNQSLDELLRRVDRMAGGQDKRSQKNLMSDADGEDENSETDVFDTEYDMAGDPPAEQSVEESGGRPSLGGKIVMEGSVDEAEAAGGGSVSEQFQKQEISGSSGARTYPPNIQRILDIQLPVTVSFGTARKQLEEILKLAPGSLIELDKGPEDPVCLLVNGKPLAWGRVVDVDGYYAVEITEILDRSERIQSLGES